MPRSPDATLAAAAAKAASHIWNDLADPSVASRAGQPLTFALVAHLADGADPESMFGLMHDATQRLMRGVTAKDVRAFLLARDPADAGVRLAATRDELAALFLRGFRLGGNAVEVAGGASGRGKHIDWCYTYASLDHRLF